jgi:hypothetical protein
LEGDKIEMKVTVPNGSIAQYQPVGMTHKSRTITNVNAKLSIEMKPETTSMELKEGRYLIKNKLVALPIRCRNF